MRYAFWAVAAVCMPCITIADTKFTLDESRDKLTDAMTRKLVVVAEDGKSTIELRHTDGSEKVTAFIDPANVIFPDHVADGNMAVSVTMRSSAMKEPVTLRCGMNFMKYDFCYIDVPPKSARLLFSGEHLTMQLARTADRLTFPLGGQDFEEALNKVLSPAEKILEAKKEREANEKEKLLREQAEREQKQKEQEQERAAREAAEKPLRDGREAGLELASKLGKKARDLGRSATMTRAKAAAKKSGYEGKDAQMFIDGYVEALGGKGK